jgi:3-phosphoshikimate 1-carboxyvinyltransferase
MNLTVRKSKLNGTVAIPGSKSHTIRAVAIGGLASGTSLIRAPLASDDTMSAVRCYRLLGAAIDASDPALWKVTGTGGRITVPTEAVDVGNSGTTLRIATGSAGLAKAGQKITFTGDHQTQNRPMAPLLEALQRLGAPCRSLMNNGKAPLEVTGGLTGGRTDIQSPTSQFLTSLLLCTPLAPQDSEINVTLLHEPGYAQMTVDWLDKQGIEYQSRGLNWFRIKGRQTYKPFDRAIPADFSSATFFLCAAALFGGRIDLHGLDFADSQPDKAVVDYLKAMGADITFSRSVVTVKGSSLKGIEIDMNRTPDALPAMSVLATFAEGTTRLVNVPQARTKGTDRIRCMAEELTKMGARVEELADGLVVHHSPLTACPVSGRGDHRIVMALSLAAMGLSQPTVIDTAEAMAVTFPNYVDLMTSLGAKMELAE